MDDDSREVAAVKWGLGLLGLGAIAAAVAIPKIGIWVGLAILLLALLFFGGYYLWRRMRLRRQREQLSSGVEAQAGAVPKTVSDPGQRANLDALRRKFLEGLQVFKSRGKDIYKLPWFVIIGESGSGKTMAIRHSGIDFPPGMQDELQGSGGTINMDWWFTNRGIIVDTAGKMIIPDEGESDLSREWKPQKEWTEFLRLLQRSRPHCPINGLLLVLSTESLIKDSADKIARKASRLAQQLDLIQRTLDVRFPVYLLVTKCDLMEGFREFSDNIADPLLQHQMFGWSNPDPLDAAFRPELVEQFLQSVADRVRRRRLALLREYGTAGGSETQTFFRSASDTARMTAGSRRLEVVNSVFALPESIMRLAPRLQRYLETIFVAGEWSAKPIFLRGIYFTSSMREGSALDEALALATNVSVDELPESGRSESRAFFLRDLFNEKIFREGGLVTRATNTLKMLRQRRLAIFGTITVALLLLLGFAWYSFYSLRVSVGKEARLWQAGTNHWLPGKIWSAGAVVSAGTGADTLHYSYAGSNLVEGTDKSVVDFHKQLLTAVQHPLAVGFIFKPVAWMSHVKDRPDAQRILFEDGVLKPLVEDTRAKMELRKPPVENPGNSRHQDALLSLMRLEADRLAGAPSQQNFITRSNAQEYLRSFVSYLTESNYMPDANLVDVLATNYSRVPAFWPPPSLAVSGGEHLSNNPAISTGLENFIEAKKATELRVQQQVGHVNELVTALSNYAQLERGWLRSPEDPCSFVNSGGYASVESNLAAFLVATNPAPGTNLFSSYTLLKQVAGDASTSSFSEITANLQPEYRSKGIFLEISDRLKGAASESVQAVETNYLTRSSAIADLDLNFISQGGLGKPAYERRHALYQMACDLMQQQVTNDTVLIGNHWTNYDKLRYRAQDLTNALAAYEGPLADSVRSACGSFASNKIAQLQGRFVEDYVTAATNQLLELKTNIYTGIESVKNAASWLEKVDADLQAGNSIGSQSDKLKPVDEALQAARNYILAQPYLYIITNAGFPVLKDSTNSMDAKKVGELRDFLTSLAGELKLHRAIWEKDNTNTFASVQIRCAELGGIASKLLDAKGAPINGKLSFVPGVDRSITDIFRGLKVAGGWEDVGAAKAPIQMGNMPVDAALQILCCKDVLNINAQPGAAREIISVGDWGLIRLLQTYQATQSADGIWHFQIPLADDSGHSGFLDFEIKFDSPLPKLEDWPKK